MPTLQQNNIQRVKDLVAEFQNGNPAGYLLGVHDDVKGSMLGGLIPGADNIVGKEAFVKIMEAIPSYMTISKFEPHNFVAVADDVMFKVNWAFKWLPTGKEVETTALVRKVLKDGMICEKYHMIDVEQVTGEKVAPHGTSTVTRVQALLSEYQAGNPAGYLAGVADNISANVFGGLLPGADRVTDKAGFEALMGTMGEYMEVAKFEPHSFHAMPNGDMIFAVDWQFKWLSTGREIETTALVRKVIDADGNICLKHHVLEEAAIAACTQPSPRDVIAAEDASPAVLCMPCADKLGEPTKEFDGAKMWVQKEAGKQMMRIEIKAGFDWRKTVKPLLPNCPDWCPATHFGYIESGEMGIQMQDGSKYTIKAGQSYFIPPGHLPVMEQDAVMVEFSQDTTYTENKNFQK